MWLRRNTLWQAPDARVAISTAILRSATCFPTVRRSFLIRGIPGVLRQWLRDPTDVRPIARVM